MSTKKVLLAGATGAVGFEVLQQLAQAGVSVSVLTRQEQSQIKLQPYATQIHLGDAANPASLRGVCDGVDVVVSCMGASLALNLKQRASYDVIDYQANLYLLQEAKQAGVARFVYVSVHPGPGYQHTRYVQAHLAFEAALQASGLSFTIIRPSGLFIAMEEFLKLAQKGIVPILGDGQSVTNPVDHREVAQTVADFVWEGPAFYAMGGPEIMTRQQIAELAFQALGKKPRFVHIPAWLFRLQSLLLRWIHPRLSQLLEFATAVNTSEALAPQVGKHTLLAYFTQRAQLSQRKTSP